MIITVASVRYSPLAGPGNSRSLTQGAVMLGLKTASQKRVSERHWEYCKIRPGGMLRTGTGRGWTEPVGPELHTVARQLPVAKAARNIEVIKSFDDHMMLVRFHPRCSRVVYRRTMSKLH
jgi:hypothetical protein